VASVQAAVDGVGSGVAAAHDAAASAAGRPTTADATTVKAGPVTATVGAKQQAAGAPPATTAQVGPFTFSVGSPPASAATAAAAQPSAKKGAAAASTTAPASSTPATASTVTNPFAAIFNAATASASTAAPAVAPRIDPVQAVTNPGGEELEPVGTKSRAGRTRAAAASVPIANDLLKLADVVSGRKTAGSPLATGVPGVGAGAASEAPAKVAP
jgi:hypothetical protein